MGYRLKYNKSVAGEEKVLIIKSHSAFCTLYNYSVPERVKYIL